MLEKEPVMTDRRALCGAGILPVNTHHGQDGRPTGHQGPEKRPFIKPAIRSHLEGLGNGG